MISATSARSAGSAGLGGLAVAWTLAAGIAISAIAQSIASIALPATTAQASSTAAPRTAAARVLGMDRDPAGSRVVLHFAPFTDPQAAGLAAQPYGLTPAANFPALGVYAFDLPRVQVSQADATTAFVDFPAVASQKEIDDYLTSNQLRVIGWIPDPDRLGSLALVSLPSLVPQLADAAKGLWRALLPPNVDRSRLDSWAHASGLQVASYNAASGELILQGPPAPRPAPAVAAPARARATVVHPTPPTTAVVTTPVTSAPLPTPVANLFLRFVPGIATTVAAGIITQTGGTQVSFDPATGAAAIAAQVDRLAALIQLYSGVPSVSCVNASAAACVPASTPVATGAPTAITTPATSGAITVSRVGPAGGILSGTVQLQLDARTDAGTGQISWTLSGPAGTASLGTAASTPSAGDPLAWTATLSWDSTRVADGSYTLTGVITDGSGNSTTVTQSYRVDNGKPTAPLGFAAAAVTGGIALSWEQASTAAAALYRVYRDGAAQPLAELSADSRGYLDTTAGAAAHTYRLVLVGNYGQASDTVTAQAVAREGNPAPVVGLKVTLPSGAQLAPDGRVTGRLLLQSQAVPTSTLTFEFTSDGGSWLPITAPVSCSDGCSADWDASALVPGHWLVRARSGGIASASTPFLIATPVALAAPSAPIAQLVAGGIELHWTPSSETLPLSYSVWKRSGSGWQLLDRTAATDYLDTSAVAGSSSEYRIQAVDRDGVGGLASATVIANFPTGTAAPSVPTTLPAPTGLSARSATGGVSLSWSPTIGATGYRVERSWSPDGPFAVAGTSAGTIFVDRAGALGGQAYYRVSATAAGLRGARSAVVTAPILPMPAPADSSAAVVVASGLAPAATARPGDLELGPGTTAGQVLAGGQLNIAAAGASLLPIGQARIELAPASAVMGWSWTALATIAAASTGSGWMALSAIRTAGVAAGNYQVRAVALAADGSTVETTAAGQIQVVHSAPAPLQVKAMAQADTVKVSWKAPSSGLPLSYSVYRIDPSSSDFMLVRSGIATTSMVDGFLPGAADVGYVVTATDAAGNESPLSNPAWLTTPTAWTSAAPQLQLLAPAPAVATSLLPGQTLLAAEVSSAAGVSSVAFGYAPQGSQNWVQIPDPLPIGGGIGGPSLAGISQLATWAATWNTAGLLGTYDLRLTATDSQGRATRQQSSVTFCGSCGRGPPAIIQVHHNSVSSADGMVTVTVPAATGLNTDLSVVASAPAEILPQGLSQVGSAYQVEASSLASGTVIHQLDRPASITFALPAGMDATAAAGLAIYHWDPAGQVWRLEPSVVDNINHLVTAIVSHFSLFALAKLTTGQTPSAVPFTISGLVFNDLNGDGIQQVSEPGLAGWAVSLLDDLGATLRTVHSDSAGAFTFTSVAPGTYTVEEFVQTGWMMTPRFTTYTVNSDFAGAVFANFKQVTISGVAFNDFNGNGVLDPGETRLTNWFIDLTPSITTQRARTFSDGAFAFIQVGPGTFTIAQELPAGWISITPATYTVTTTSGANVSGLAFGDQQVTSVTGAVFNDLNGDGRPNAGEPVLQGVIIDLLNGSAIVARATTDANGNYSLTSPGPGNYTIAEEVPAGWVQTSTPTTYSVSDTGIPGTTFANLLFGNFQLVSLGGWVFNDLVGAGQLFDPSFPRLPGWTVDLMRGTAIVQRATTDANGNFTFTNVGPGGYTMSEEQQTGWILTTTGVLYWNAWSGSGPLDFRWGNFQRASISGESFNDLNGDGLLEPGEPGLPGWTIQLFYAGKVIQTAISDANGNYTLTGLGPGVYFVQEVAQSGWTIVLTTGYVVNTRSGINATGNVFANLRDGTFVSGTVSGVVYRDITGNGFSPDDVPLTDVPTRVELWKDQSPFTATTSGPDGSYSFNNLGPGIYWILGQAPLRFIQTGQIGATVGVPFRAFSSFNSTGNNLDEWPPTSLQVTGLKYGAEGTPQTFAVRAYDYHSNTVTNYTGTIFGFSVHGAGQVSDQTVISSYSFLPADQGVHGGFPVSFHFTGGNYVTVADLGSVVPGYTA